MIKIVMIEFDKDNKPIMFINSEFNEHCVHYSRRDDWYYYREVGGAGTSYTNFKGNWWVDDDTSSQLTKKDLTTGFNIDRLIPLDSLPGIVKGLNSVKNINKWASEGWAVYCGVCDDYFNGIYGGEDLCEHLVWDKENELYYVDRCGGHNQIITQAEALIRFVGGTLF